MEKLLKKYIENLQLKKLSYNTIEAYTRDLQNFIKFLKGRNEDLNSIQTDTIILYVDTLQKEGKANTSVIRNIISIRNFYKFLIINKFVEEDPTLAYDIPKKIKESPKILTVEEVDRFLSQPDITTDKGVRDKAMLEIMYATGLKVSELLNLTIFDKNMEMAYIRVERKNKNERLIPMGSVAIKALKEYLKIRDHFNVKQEQLLFLNTKGGQMTRQGFWKIIKMYAKEASINKHINANTLRHSFAVHLIQNGADIKSVQQLLGHNSISATQVYTVITKQNKLEQVYKNAHPRA